MIFIKHTQNKHTEVHSFGHALLNTVAFSEGSGLHVAAYRKELLLGVCADGQCWPQTLSSLHSPPLTNKPLIVRHAGSPQMSKGPFYPGWLAHIKDTHTHSAADRDGPSPADVTATALVLSPITKIHSDFACDRCTLGLQMDRDVGEGIPVFLQACLGTPGNAWLLCQLQLWLKK